MVKYRKSHLYKPYYANKDLYKVILKYNRKYNVNIYLFFEDEYKVPFVWNTFNIEA